MQEISSLQNPIIKKAVSLHQRKHRQKTGLFIIEGFKGIEETIKSGLEIENIFLSRKKEEKASFYPENLLYLVNDRILKKISTTDTPCEILAIAKQFTYSIKDLLIEKSPLVIVLEDIKDPGNLGTIIRTAKAAEVSGIVLTGSAVDIFNPKTVRATAGNLWKIPLLYFEKKEKIKEVLSSYKKFQFISTSLKEGCEKSYLEIDYKLPSVIMFGSEAKGISEELSKQAEINIKIPMSKDVESLNLSVSAGIVLYEALRQRKFSV